MMSTSSPRGAFCAASLRSSSKSLSPDAARVFRGPGEMAWTRMPRGPQLVGEVPARRLERRLHRPHHVVVGHHPVRADVAHGEHRPAVLHQGCGQLRHPDEGVAGDVHRLGEPCRRAVQEPALEVLLRREGDGVDQAVQLPPASPDEVEHRLELAGDAHVQRGGERRSHLAGERLDVGPCLLVQPGDRQLRPQQCGTPWRSRRRWTGRWPLRPPEPCGPGGPVGSCPAWRIPPCVRRWRGARWPASPA